MPPSFDFIDLVPDLAHWEDGRGIDIDAWICCIGSFEHAIGYTRLFWPAFLEHDHAVFLAARFDPDVYAAWMKDLAGDRRAVERVMNHRHIAHLFGDPELAPTPAQIAFIGAALREMWGAKLERDFPGRRFDVTFDASEKEDVADYEITFGCSSGTEAHPRSIHQLRFWSGTTLFKSVISARYVAARSAHA